MYLYLLPEVMCFIHVTLWRFVNNIFYYLTEHLEYTKTFAIFTRIPLTILVLYFKDVAIAYGYNNIPRMRPASLTPLHLNVLSDLLRLEVGD